MIEFIFKALTEFIFFYVGYRTAYRLIPLLTMGNVRVDAVGRKRTKDGDTRTTYPDSTIISDEAGAALGVVFWALVILGLAFWFLG